MLGQYVLHYPITDFAVSLVVLAAFVDLLGRALERPHWKVAVDWLLMTGFAGGLAAMGTGLWLAVDHHPANETRSPYTNGLLTAPSAPPRSLLLRDCSNVASLASAP